VKAHLPGTLSFHTTPPTLVPTRHRNRHPQSHLAVDSNGVEHLLLHFWITSSHLTDAQKPKQSWVERLRDGWNVEWDWERAQEIGRHLKGKARDTWESVKQTAAFVSGIPIQPTPYQAPPLATTSRQQRVEEERRPESAGWTFFGLFRNLKLGGGMSKSNNPSLSAITTQWDTAEAHVDLVKVRQDIMLKSALIRIL
jgi:import inner membrane translocase subunit TIM21